VATLTAKLKEKDDLVAVLRASLLTPEPAIDFGAKGDVYSAKAFRFVPVFPPSTHL
jgi:hypothetical protein